jgi:hypothetical protein
MLGVQEESWQEVMHVMELVTLQSREVCSMSNGPPKNGFRELTIEGDIDEESI